MTGESATPRGTSPTEVDLRAAIEAGLRAWGRAGGICVTAKMRGEIADCVVAAARGHA